MIKAIFFDLFFTLITPAYEKADNEYDILGLSAKEWEHYAEDCILYQERALGHIRTEAEIIEKIMSLLPFEPDSIQRANVLCAREMRMKKALQQVSDDILTVLQRLESMNLKLGLISNADTIDCKYWNQSPLCPYFDEVIFSCDVGLLKPDPKIYELAMRHLDMTPEQCLFVGDGGSNELYGAQAAGMKTAFSEMLETKTREQKKAIIRYADYHVNHLNELFRYV